MKTAKAGRGGGREGSEAVEEAIEAVHLTLPRTQPLEFSEHLLPMLIALGLEGTLALAQGLARLELLLAHRGHLLRMPALLLLQHLLETA